MVLARCACYGHDFYGRDFRSSGIAHGRERAGTARARRVVGHQRRRLGLFSITIQPERLGVLQSGLHERRLAVDVCSAIARMLQR